MSFKTCKGTWKSVTFNPSVTVASFNNLDQGTDRSLVTGSASTSKIHSLKRLPSILIKTSNRASSAHNLSLLQNRRSDTRDESTRKMTFQQLEADLKKCMRELEREEEIFLDQVKKVNNHDRILTANREKIEKLESKVETLGNDHNRMSETISCLMDQQSQMDVILSKLESSMPSIPPEMNVQRNYLYELSDGIGKELLQIGTDLEFVADQISEPDVLEARNNHPMASIVQILKGHADVLTWVEDNFVGLEASLQSVQQEHETIRRQRVDEMLDLV